MRLFVAIELDGGIRTALTDLQKEWRRQRIRGNYTPPENMHLTLAFIGEQPDPEAAEEALSALSFAPFEIRLSGAGCFRDLWWAGIEDSEALDRCAAQVRRLLSQAGVPFDRKKFSPHVTLNRQLGAPLPPAAPRGASMTVGKISLFRSDRGKHGMIYTEIASFPADGE